MKDGKKSRPISAKESIYKDIVQKKLFAHNRAPSNPVITDRFRNTDNVSSLKLCGSNKFLLEKNNAQKLA